MGSSCRDAASGPGARKADQRNTNTLAAQRESQERTAAAHSPEPAPATAFISGYTDLRNEGRAPNVLFFPVSHYTPEPPLPSLCTPFLSLPFAQPKSSTEKQQAF